jgi:DNA-binding NarL/FixJ family response regulator
MPFDVLVVDDHKIVRYGIKAILDREDEFRVVGEAETGSEALQFVRQHQPDLVLMDIGLPGISGVEATAEITRQHPACKVVVLSMYGDENSVIGAVKSGARGFLLKKTSEGDLVDALRVVARGGAHFSPQVSDRLLSRIQKGNLDANRHSGPVAALSPREMQVLSWVAQGKTSKEIAVILDLKEQTVRSYRKTMMKKLKVNNASSLTRLAYSVGLVEPPSAADDHRAEAKANKSS